MEMKAIFLVFLQLFFVRFLNLFYFYTNQLIPGFHNMLLFHKKTMGHKVLDNLYTWILLLFSQPFFDDITINCLE